MVYFQMSLRPLPGASGLGSWPPYVFNFHNDISCNLISDSFLFADDASLFNQYKSCNELVVINNLEYDLRSLLQWSAKWNVLFNYSKTQIVNFTCN